MSGSAVTVRVGADWNGGAPTGGTPLQGLVPFGDLSFSTAFQRPSDNSGGGGLLTAQWSLSFGTGPIPDQLRMNSLVELFAGPCSLGAAVITETPRGDTVVADGLFRLGEWFQAVDSSGNPTTDVAVAVARAITDGLRWRDPGGLPSGSVSALSEGNVQFNTVSTLINRYCQLNGKFWFIDRNHFLRIVDEPSTATAQTWALSPLVPNPQTADDDYASRYFIRRVDGVDSDGQPNAWAPNSASDPTAPMIREVAEDLEQMGYMSAPAGAAAAGAYLNANKARASFSEGVEVSRGQVTTLGGTAPELWAPCGGEMVVQPNWLSASGDLVLGQRRTWIIGGTTWRQNAPLQVTPLGIAPRTVAQITGQGGSRRLVFA